MQSVPLGFEPSRLLDSKRPPTIGADGKSDARTTQFLSDVLDRVRQIPGVNSAAAISAVPMSGAGHNAFNIEGRPAPPNDVIQDATLNSVAPGYFETMQIALEIGTILCPCGFRFCAESNVDQRGPCAALFRQ